MSKNATLSSEIVQLLKPDIASKEMIIFADSNNSIREVLRQHQQMADFGNQTSLVATPNASEKDPNETVIDTSKSNPKSQLDNIEVSSKKSAAGQSQRTSKATSRRREAEELELKNLKAKQEAEQRLRELEMQAKNDQDKMEMEMQMQLELKKRKHERELENERKKAQDEEERRQLELEQKRGSSRASGSIANDVESHGSSKKHGYTKDWIQELPDPNYTPPALSPKIAVDLPKKTFPQVEKDKRLQTFFGFQKLWSKQQESQDFLSLT